MINRYLKIRNIIITSVVLLTLVGLFFANYFYTLNYSGGKYFQTQWIATRAVITDNSDPYSESVLYKIQESAYNRPAMAGEYEFRFVYPYFSLLLFLPFGLIKSYAIARASWMLFLEILVVLIWWLSLNIADWKPNFRIKILLFVFTATFYHSIRAVVDGNLMILMTVLLIGALIAIRDQKDEIAGILLTGFVLEIQYTFLIGIIILWYLVANKRYLAIKYFAGSLILLSGFSFLIKPDWALQFINQLLISVSSFSYVNFSSSLRIIWGNVGQRFAITFTIIFSLILIVEAILTKRKSYKYFLWFVFLTIIVIQWIGLPSASDNLILLLPGLFFGLKVINDRWNNRGEMVVFTVCIMLYSIIWLIYFSPRNSGIGYVDSISFYLVLPIIQFGLLYWAKWWVKRKSNFVVKL